MANQWLRLWHDMPNDPKWRTIAKASGQSIGDVISVFLHILVDASANASERGKTQSINAEDIASALDIDSAAVLAIIGAMEGRVIEGNAVLGWEKRQPQKEDGAAERARAWREEQKRKKEEEERNRTQPNAQERPDKDTDKELKSSCDQQAESQGKINGSGLSYTSIKDAYNRICVPTLPACRTISKKRQSLIRSLVNIEIDGVKPFRVHGIPFVEAFFIDCMKNPHWVGANGWRADFDFLINTTNAIKALERNL